MIRVAVPSLGDPAIARALFPSVADLCRIGGGPRVWRLDCRAPAEVRAALAGPGLRLRGSRLVVPFAWRRLPELLARIPVPGVRHVRAVNAGPRQLSFTWRGVRYEFLRMEPHRAAAAFRRGEVDVAPVPEGDLKAVEADPLVAPALHRRPVLVLDLVRFDVRRGPLAPVPNTRRLYWRSAPRGDYVRLTDAAGPAFGLVPGAAGGSVPTLHELRDRIKQLPPLHVRLETPPELGYEAAIVTAEWRTLGLDARTATRPAPDRFVRVAARYPEPEAVFLALLGPDPRLRPALAARDPLPALRRLDAQLEADAEVVPLAWRASSYLVSPRLQGWRQDRLGVPDYTRVRARARSPSR